MKKSLQANVFSIMLVPLVVILKEAHYKPQMYWKMIFPPPKIEELYLEVSKVQRNSFLLHKEDICLF